MGVLRQAVADGRHGIDLEALLIAVGSACVVCELRFQNVGALFLEAELAAVVIQCAIGSFCQGNCLAGTGQRPPGGTVANFPEGRFYSDRMVGVKDLRQIKAD